MQDSSTADYTPTTESVLATYMIQGQSDDQRACLANEFDRWLQAELRKARAEALRGAADYAASGIHCAEMWVAPASTIQWLRDRADQIEEEQE